MITEYVLPLGQDARKRHIHETRRGRVISFMVQLEVRVGDRWRPVVRYDSAHGFAHKDRYYLDGRTIKMDLHLSFNEALTIADEDIKNNWDVYKAGFLRGE